MYHEMPRAHPVTRAGIYQKDVPHAKQHLLMPRPSLWLPLPHLTVSVSGKFRNSAPSSKLGRQVFCDWVEEAVVGFPGC